jgi:hypothetical protein
MNMNWGNKLILVFIVFAGLILTLVYKASTAKFDLVSKEYYKEELRYQDKIDGMHNANKLSKVIVAQDTNSVTIQLPKEMNGEKITGEAWFYCRTDAEKDKKIILEVDDSSRQLIMKHLFVKGPYQLKLNWQAASGNYYTEQEITIH